MKPNDVGNALNAKLILLSGKDVFALTLMHCAASLVRLFCCSIKAGFPLRGCPATS